ncbi:MAG: epoxide hydrolase [Bryobacteraceae bacterium]|nr:epoxide hydrolase [Bryobacteraceae bacterium]
MISTNGPEPFTIAFSDEQLADLKMRLSRTRWPDQIPDSGWGYGMNSAVLRELVGYWAGAYDWRERERKLNSEPQFIAEIDGIGIHFIHKRTKGHDGRKAIPLLLLHGWPGSFVQMLSLLPLLTDPDVPDAPAFDVVVPSLPGYGFSAIPHAPGMSTPRIAPLMHALMTEVLGYSRYGLRSSDLGAGVAARIAADYPDSIIGSHTGGTNPYLGPVPDDLGPEEQAFVKAAQAWSQSEMAYAQEHSSKPQTLAHALNDSPAGLAAWIVEKVWRWGDISIPLDRRVDRDALLDNLTIYWMTGTIGSSMRLYYETARDPNAWARPDVPTAYLMSPHDMFSTPRRWVERSARVDRWTEIDCGGHFLEWEIPHLVAEDLRAFFGPLR